MPLPTDVAPDGSPVAVYLALPAHEEARLIHHALAPGASVLDLGCGVGRLSRQLAEWGHHVVAVDQSVEMLWYVKQHPNVTFVRADIETLSLDLQFGGVVLPSYLVNTPDRTQRERFLETCRRYVTDDGGVVIHRVDPETQWIVGAASSYGPVRVCLRDVARQGDVVRIRLEYNVDGQVFEQAVVAEILTDTALADELQRAGLVLERWLNPARTWLLARPSIA